VLSTELILIVEDLIILCSYVFCYMQIYVVLFAFVVWTKNVSLIIDILVESMSSRNYTSHC